MKEIKHINLEKVIQIVLFVGLAYVYLYIGYHNKDYVFDFSLFQFVLHTGVDSSEYISDINQVSSVLSSKSRWVSAIFVMFSLSIVSSCMVWVFFMKRKYFIVSLVYYTVLIALCGCYIFVFSLISQSELGYQVARFVKDNFIHTPFVFVVLVASLKVFKI